MSAHLEIGRNLLWSALLAFGVCTYLASGSLGADPITKMIELDQATNDWCHQHLNREDQIHNCRFNSQ